MQRTYARILLVASVMIIGAVLLLGRSISPTDQTARPEGHESYQPQTETSSDEPMSAAEPGAATPNHNSESQERATETYEASRADKRNGDKILTADGQSFPLRRYRTQQATNDPYSNQWWESAIDISAAWQRSAGERQTVLVIIDTGFSMSHEEFSNRFYQNPAESGPTSQENPSILNCSDRGLALDRSCNLIDDDGDGIVDNESGTTNRENPSILNCSDRGLALDRSCNLIDDSGNGLIDDVTGYDFVSFHPSVAAGKQNPSGSGTTHGTIVAGIAAATGNNGVGIAGVDWHTRILPIQAINDDGYGDSLSVGRAIRYAASQGADVINLSLGTDQPDPYIRLAIRDALQAGSMVVAASGNDGCECMIYPAMYPETIAVGALNQSSERASFSSWGDALDVLAPGVSLVAPTWQVSNNAAYATASGTSLAAPVVSGLLTLARSHQPEASWTELRGVLGQLADRTVINHTTHSPEAGYGVVSAAAYSDRYTQAATLRGISRFILSGTSGTFHSSKVYQCQPGEMGGLRLYRLSGSNSLRYSVNELYRDSLVQSGWSSRLVTHACVSLPTDDHSSVRLINPLREFENSFAKPTMN
jgi:subtilisin family serine protease